MIKKFLKSLLFIPILLCLYGFTVPSAPYSDPPDSYTKLQCSFDEADGSTTTDDESASNYTVTNNGNVQTDSGRTKFSNTSLFDGTGDFWTLADSDDWNFGTGNFTIDTWVYYSKDPASDAYHSPICEQRAAADSFIYWGVYDGSLLSYVRSGGTTVYYFTPGTANHIVINTWYHVAIVRYGTGLNNIYIYIDGVSRSITWQTNLAENASLPDLAAVYRIGYSEVQTAYTEGSMDEFRISKGIARDWASVRRIIDITYGIDIGSPNMVGTPLWSCRIKLEKLWRNFAWKLRS